MLRKIFVSIIYLYVLVVQTSCFAGLMDYPNVAVLNFSKKAAVSQDLTFEDASMVADHVIGFLTDSEMFNVVEREQIRAITDEHSFNSTGLIDLGTAAQLSKLHGVQYLVYGSVTGLSVKNTAMGYENSERGKIDGTKYTVVANISARFIEVETGRIVLAARGKGESSSTGIGVGFGKRKNNLEDCGENEGTDSNYSQGFRIGAVTVSQEQVDNALIKAAEDVVFGKFGFLEKLENKGKRKKDEICIQGGLRYA